MILTRTQIITAIIVAICALFTVLSFYYQLGVFAQVPGLILSITGIVVGLRSSHLQQVRDHGVAAPEAVSHQVTDEGASGYGRIVQSLSDKGEFEDGSDELPGETNRVIIGAQEMDGSQTGLIQGSGVAVDEDELGQEITSLVQQIVHLQAQFSHASAAPTGIQRGSDDRGLGMPPDTPRPDYVSKP